MKKTEIIECLESSFAELVSFFENQEDSQFDQPIAPGKWTFGQHAEHLLLSARALKKAMKMPKIMLRTTFGTKNERPEKTYGEVVKKYRSKLAEGLVAATNPPGTRFAPSGAGTKPKGEILDKFKSEMSELKAITGKWKEEQLTKYLLPHPLLGKMTVREMLYFTVFHTKHHYDVVRGNDHDG